jgi:hypothetical protein
MATTIASQMARRPVRTRVAVASVDEVPVVMGEACRMALVSASVQPRCVGGRRSDS